MKTTIEYISEAKNRLGIESDYALARALGVSKQAISQYQSGHRIIDDYTAAKIAEVLEIDPLEVIAAANAEREKDEARRDYWRKIFRTASAAALAFSVNLQGLDAGRNFNEAESVYYVK